MDADFREVFAAGFAGVLAAGFFAPAEADLPPRVLAGFTVGFFAPPDAVLPLDDDAGFTADFLPVAVFFDAEFVLADLETAGFFVADFAAADLEAVDFFGAALLFPGPAAELVPAEDLREEPDEEETSPWDFDVSAALLEVSGIGGFGTDGLPALEAVLSADLECASVLVAARPTVPVVPVPVPVPVPDPGDIDF